MKDVVAVLLDLVDSRTIAARSRTQREIEAALGHVDEVIPALESLHPTVGDEFQGIYASIDDALVATLLARLQLPDGVDCRIGLGRGEIRTVGTGSAGELQDGPGWWRARTAIDRAHALEDGPVPSARGWYVAAETATAQEQTVNAYLLARDALVGAMGARDRRLAAGVLSGRSQRELAAAESITQSAVSQALRRSGVGALREGLRQLRAEGAPC